MHEHTHCMHLQADYKFESNPIRSDPRDFKIAFSFNSVGGRVGGGGERAKIHMLNGMDIG